MAVSYANKVAGTAPAANGGRGTGTFRRVQPAGPPPAPGQHEAEGKGKEPAAKVAAPANNGVQGNERLLFGANVLIGYRVEVQVKSGVVYEGIFHTMNISGSDVHVVLKYAKLIKDPSSKPGLEKDALAERPTKTMTVLSKDLVQVIAKDVRFNPEDLAADDRNDHMGFDTDAAISRGRAGAGVRGRELQKWVPDETENDDLLSLGLEGGDHHGGGGGGGGGQWDQFAVNREKFGVESTFDEHLYTTKIDHDNCGITEAEAEKIAREIEGGFTNSSLHVMEERGFIVDDSGDVDEEDKYSAVVRPGAQQQHQHHQGHHGMQDRRPRYQQHPGYQHHGQQGQPGPRAPAWGGMGSGVVAVSGRVPGPGGVPPPPPPPQRTQPPLGDRQGSAGGAPLPVLPAAGSSAPVDIAPPSSHHQVPPASAPIDMDPLRREANKVRSQLLADTGAVAGKRDRMSPYGTPKGLKDSPLVRDPDSMRALHLIPGKTNVSPEVNKDFKAWKQQLQQGQDNKPQLIDDLKKFGSSFNAPGLKAESKVQAPGGAAGTPSASIASAATPAAAASAAATPAAAPAEAAAPSAPAAAGPETDGEAAAAGAAAAEPVKKSSGLNPNAKPFSLNFNAKPFVPPAAAAPAAPAGAAESSAAPAAGGTAAAAAGSTAAAPPAAASAGPSSSQAAAGSQHAGSAAPPPPAPHSPASHSAHGGHYSQHSAAAGPHHGGSGGGGGPQRSGSGNGMHPRAEREQAMGMHMRGEREPRGPGQGGMERRGGPGQGGGMGGGGVNRMGMMGGEGHYSGHGPVHHVQGQMQGGPGGHKMMGMGPGGHHMGGEQHERGPPHMGLTPDHMGHKGPQHMGMSAESIGHKGAPPPPHHGPGMQMEPGAMMQNMAVHGMPPHMGPPMAMSPPFIHAGPPFHMGPGGAMVPAGAMMPAPVFQAHGIRPGMAPNGAPMPMVTYPYPMAMQAGGQDPSGRYFHVAMPGPGMPMMAGPMPPQMEHQQRMGGPGSSGSSTPTGGGKGMRGSRQERREGGFHGDSRHQQHHAPQHHPAHDGGDIQE